jgi:hypothetical protein
MKKPKSYKEQNTQQTVNEPIAEYSSVSMMEDFVNSIPEDALMQAAQFAVKEHREGRCIPHSQIDSVIKERMGWK